MNIQDTLNERQSTHGNYVDQAVLSCTILESFRSGANWSKLNSTHEFALMMIAAKIGRILTGDPNFTDSWHDIAGYATLVEQSLPSPHHLTKEEYCRQWQEREDAWRREQEAQP